MRLQVLIENDQVDLIRNLLVFRILLVLIKKVLCEMNHLMRFGGRLSGVLLPLVILVISLVRQNQLRRLKLMSQKVTPMQETRAT